MEKFIVYDWDRDHEPITKFLNRTIIEGWQILSVTPTYYFKKMSGDLELRSATVHVKQK
jgi:hypothetical protein